MAIVAGVDFGTLSVRVSIVDSERGMLASATAEYPLHRKREDPDFATQSHDDHMRALAEASRQAVRSAGIAGDQVQSIALDTTGSSVIPVGEGLVPLDDYYLWCDHRAKQEARQITELARQEKLEAIDWCGGVYSSEWGFAKLLHWLRHNPEKRAAFASAKRQGIDVGPEPFLAAGGRQKVCILRLAPIPIQAMLSERFIECAAMGFLGIRQCSVDIEYQRLEFHANTRLARRSSPSMVMSSSRVSCRPFCANRRLAWRRRARSSALRIERAFAK